MKLRPIAGLAAGLVLLAAPAAAPAAPITVQLRIEGPQHTLFEGPVTTDIRTFHFTGDPTAHTCDGVAPSGASTAPVVTSGAVLAAAEDEHGLVVHGAWNSDFANPSFTDIGGENVGGAGGEFLGEFHGDPGGHLQFADFGSCGEPAVAGGSVVYAYGSFGEPLLALSGPANAPAGATVTVRVTDAQTGAPVAGASVGGALSAADGSATLGPLGPGSRTLKATKAGTIRSNAVTIAVAAPGAPPPVVTPPDRTPPVARILGLRDHESFRARRAPRTLRFSVPSDPSGLKMVQLRLTRQLHGRYWYFSGARARFVRSRFGKRVPFSVPVQPTVSYLLPHRLGRGRYVLDVLATDGAGNREPLARGTSRVVFFVR